MHCAPPQQGHGLGSRQRDTCAWICARGCCRLPCVLSERPPAYMDPTYRLHRHRQGTHMYAQILHTVCPHDPASVPGDSRGTRASLQCAHTETGVRYCTYMSATLDLVCGDVHTACRCVHMQTATRCAHRGPKPARRSRVCCLGPGSAGCRLAPHQGHWGRSCGDTWLPADRPARSAHLSTHSRVACPRSGPDTPVCKSWGWGSWQGEGAGCCGLSPPVLPVSRATLWEHSQQLLAGHQGPHGGAACVRVHTRVFAQTYTRAHLMRRCLFRTPTTDMHGQHDPTTHVQGAHTHRCAPFL